MGAVARQLFKLVSRLGGALEMRFLWPLGLRGWLSSWGPLLSLRLDISIFVVGWLGLFCLFGWFWFFEIAHLLKARLTTKKNMYIKVNLDSRVSEVHMISWPWCFEPLVGICGRADRESCQPSLRGLMVTSLQSPRDL